MNWKNIDQGGISSSVLSVFFTDKFDLSLQMQIKISVAYNSLSVTDKFHYGTLPWSLVLVKFISCCYVRQTSVKLSGCQEQPLFKWDA